MARERRGDSRCRGVDIHAIHGANPCHSLNARRGSRVGVNEVEGIGTAEAASPDAGPRNRFR